jgi:hypothetical protein
LDGGLGGVYQKNNFILTDTLSWGLTACKHANGRDWWIVFMEDGNPTAYIYLYTPIGMQFMSKQNFGITSNTYGNVCQLLFSQDGTKFLYTTPVNQTQSGMVIVSDFDRCTGVFTNAQSIIISPSSYVWGIAFSPSGEFAYVTNSQFVYQINTSTLAFSIVANYDGFISGLPPTCCTTTFYLMYLAANGKIYVTSGSSTQHIHEINYPDSAGVACDVQQHAINVGVWQFRAVPNHPNYYLGAADGTICDSLGLNSLHDSGYLEQSFTLKPNPNSGVFEVLYLLPQGEEGTLEVFDISGKKIYSQYLPPWSTMQGVSLPEAVPAGLYNAVIRSEGYYAARKFVLSR